MKKTENKEKKRAVDLDALLTVTEGAAWLGISESTLLRNIRRRKIPAVHLNARVFRIHPRTVLLSKGARL